MSSAGKFHRLLSLIKMRPEEAPTALLMTVYFFLAMGCVSVVKAIQNALYLGQVGFDLRLPILYVILALAAVLVVLLFRRLARTHSRINLNLYSLSALILTLMFFLVVLQSQRVWVYPLFYIWGGVFSVLVPTQGWLLSYEFYTTREAKRLFSVLGTGGILGGAGGGYYAYFMAGWIRTEWLLIHVALAIVVMQSVLLMLRRTSRGLTSAPQLSPVGSDTAEEEKGGLLENIFESRYLSFLAGVILVTAGTTTMIDLGFKLALEQQFRGSTSQITEFYGILLGTMFIFSALFQLLGTSRILRSLGVGVGLLILPLSLVAGTIPVIVVAAFWSVVGLKVIDGCLRTSIHRTSVELLYIPIDEKMTVTFKGMVDLVVFRLGDALGAAIFLVVLSLSAVPLQAVTVAILLATGLWTLLAWRLGKEYLRNLRRSLEIHATPASRKVLQLQEAAAEKTLVEALQSSSSAKIHFALRQLILAMSENGSQNGGLPDQSTEMIYPQIHGHQPPSWLDSVVPLVNHPDLQVAAAALHLLIGYRPDKYWEQVKTSCSRRSAPDALCLFYLDRYLEVPQSLVSRGKLLSWARHAAPDQARILARLMGKYRQPEFLPILKEWVAQPDRSVARSALEALGRYRDPDQLDFLLHQLAHNWSKRASRRALNRYGSVLVPRLMKVLQDKESEIAIKREIPFILASIDTRAAREGLVSSLYLNDPVVSFRALKGLNQIRERGRLRFGEGSFAPVLQIWVREYYELMNLDLLLGEVKGKADRLLKKAVRERIEWNIEKMFRGLDLFLPPGDAYFSYLGFTSNEQGLRENAIELIDLRVRGELRQTMLPVFTSHTQAEAVDAGRHLFHLPSRLNEVLSEALFSADPWLKCCIIAAVKTQGLEQLRPRVMNACQDIHPLVRETARWALDTWAS